MDRQYLESFTEDQLKHYLNTLKRRVLEMKNLTITLGQENLELADEYKTLVERKKEAYLAVEKKKKSWSNWIHKSKDKISNMLHLNKEEPSEFDPQFAKQQQRQVEEVHQDSLLKQNDQREVEAEKKDINMSNFNFDDLYYISRDKIAGLMGKGGEQIKHIKELLIDKVVLKDSKVENDENCQNEDEKREAEDQHQNYAQLTKEKDLNIRNTPPKTEESSHSRKSQPISEKEYTPADL